MTLPGSLWNFATSKKRLFEVEFVKTSSDVMFFVPAIRDLFNAVFVVEIHKGRQEEKIICQRYLDSSPNLLGCQ